MIPGDPLQECPYFFMNGKFKLVYKYSGVAMGIMGYYPQTGRIEVDKNEGGSDLITDLSAYKLAARPHGDMTNDEYLENWRLLGEFEYTTPSSMMYLLSIGVYPFGDTHFTDGTVININEVEEYHGTSK